MISDVCLELAEMLVFCGWCVCEMLEIAHDNTFSKLCTFVPKVLFIWEPASYKHYYHYIPMLMTLTLFQGYRSRGIALESVEHFLF